MNEEVMNTNMGTAAPIEETAANIEENETEVTEVMEPEQEQTAGLNETALPDAAEAVPSETAPTSVDEPAMPGRGIDFATVGKVAAGVMIGVGGCYVATEKVIPAAKAIIADTKQKIENAKKARAEKKAKKLRKKAEDLVKHAGKLAPVPDTKPEPEKTEQTTE